MNLMAGVLLVFARRTTEEANTKEVANVSGVRTEGYVTPENGNVSSKQGTSGSFFWTLYQEGGKADITQGANGNFAITYSGCNDVVGEKDGILVLQKTLVITSDHCLAVMTLLECMAGPLVH